MPHTIEWLQEGKVIMSRFYGVLTMQEMFEATPEYIALFEEGNPPVHIITDMSGLTQYPTNLLQTREALSYMGHEGMGWQAYYGAPALASSLINVFTTVMQTRLSTFRSFDLAIAFLHEKDSAVRLTIAE